MALSYRDKVCVGWKVYKQAVITVDNLRLAQKKTPPPGVFSANPLYVNALDKISNIENCFVRLVDIV